MKKTREDKVVDAITVVLLVIVLIIIVIPFLAVLSSAFEDEEILLEKGMALIPTSPTLDTFAYLFRGQIGGGKISIALAFWNSIKRTVLGTAISIATQLMFAYALTFRKLRGRKVINILMIITMFFGGGIIPIYLLFNAMNMLDTIFPLIILGAVSPYTVYIMRNFITAIPYSLTEAAYLDGANEVQIFFRVIFPLSLPIVATYALFAAVGQWNDWFNAFIVLNSEEKDPRMLVLKDIISNSSSIQPGAGDTSVVIPNELGLNCAAIVVVTIPMLLVYPFAQKYFVQGTMLGSVKE